MKIRLTILFAIAVCIYLIYAILIKRDYELLIFMVITIFFYYIFSMLNQENLKKICRIFFIIAGIFVILNIFVSSILLFKLFVWFTVIPVMINLTFVKKDTSKSQTFEEDISKELVIDGITKTYNKSLPKLIGGFVMPGMPIFSVLNKKWKKRKKEAIIHEKVHLMYLIRKGGILYIIGLPLVLFTLFDKILNIQLTGIYVDILFYLCFIGSFTYFEYVTFRKTNEIGDKFKVKTTKWNWSICRKYLVVYMIQIGIIFVMVKGLKWLIKLV